MNAENKNCLINEAACGRIEGNPVCPKCGMDERVVYPGRADLEAAIEHGKVMFKNNASQCIEISDWNLHKRPRLKGDLLDVDNEMLIEEEDLNWGAPPTYQGVREARKRYVERIQFLAAEGNHQAKLIFGRMLVNGVGAVLANQTKAHFLYREVLNEGNEEACSYIGALYENGEAGFPQDDAKAREWYERGYSAGDPRAAYFLADFTAEGKGGLNKDEGKALKMALEAAKNGCGAACVGLGFKHHLGEWGLDPNSKKATELMELGLARGHAGGGTDWAFQLGNPKEFFSDFSRNSMLKILNGHIAAVSDEGDPLKIFNSAIEEMTPGLVQSPDGREWVLSGNYLEGDKEAEGRIQK